MTVRLPLSEIARIAVMMLLLGGALSAALAAVAENELLEPEKAFRISTRALDERNVEVTFQIADGYYMYRDRFKFETASGRLLADVELPKGKVKVDSFFGKTETYRREVQIRVPLTAEDSARESVKLKVTSQGCADVGVCYIPLEQFVSVRLAGIAPAAGASTWQAQAASWPEALSRSLRSRTQTRGPVAGSGAFLVALAAYFALGLAAGLAHVSSSPAVQRNRPVEVRLARISLRLLIYTVVGVVAGFAGAVAFNNVREALITAVLAAAFTGLAITAWLAPHASVQVATAGLLLLVVNWGDALLGGAGLGLFSLAISLVPGPATRWGAGVAARLSPALLAIAAGALALWIASPLFGGPPRLIGYQPAEQFVKVLDASRDKHTSAPAPGGSR